MNARLLPVLFVVACAGCTQPGAQPTTPNGDVIRRSNPAAPDTVSGAKPPANYRDQAVDTDPSSPRTRDTGQRVQVPFIAQ